MNIKKLIENITENWGQKVICILLAIILYVINNVASLEKKTYIVPLNVDSSSLMMPISDYPKYVKVFVRTKTENFPAINSSNFKATLKLGNFTDEGKTVVPITLDLDENLLLLDPLEYYVKPEFIVLNLEQKELKYIPIKPAISGDVEHGYTISKVEVSPSSVKVVGPKSIISKTDFIDSKRVVVSGAATNFTKELKLDNINAKLDVFPESDFKVTVSVIPANDERRYSNINITAANLSDDFEIQGTLPTVTMRLASTVQILDAYKINQNTVSIDCSDIYEEGTYELPLIYKIPANIALIDKSIENITLNIIKKELPVVEENADSTEEKVSD